MEGSKYPISVLWNFGYQCNMNCLHCYSRPEAKKRHEKMTDDEAMKIADEIIKSRALHVHFGGGEPLMRKDFLSIASKIRQSGLTVSFSTNGTFLSQKLADQIADIPINVVGVSIYGSNNTTHDAFTRYPGSFDGLIKACKYLKNSGVRQKFVVILCKKTVTEAVKIIRLASGLNIDGVQFYTLKFSGNAIKRINQLRLSPDEWKIAYERIFSEAEKKPQLNIDFGLDNDPLVAGYLGRPFTSCPCGKYSIVVRPSGDVSACGVAVNIIGNVHNQSLLDIWENSPELLAIRSGGKNPCQNLRT